ncbi:MAG: FeoB-associated Cys-rich membrane protein [Ruminococcaceae bacterium]|nr:FeoB-associated Cys-rich membrane protein [Oscillospiraceae bacterium]
MIEFVQQYLGSILVGAGVLAVVAMIIVKAVKDKRAGRSSCGCDCAHCGCHCNNDSSLQHSNTK